ncbi:MAG TPA: DUF1294 domain-containing protein [Savagea sp.]
MIIWIIYYILLTIIGTIAMRVDKRRAILGQYRVSEKRLLTIGLLGGGFGIAYGARRYRHKTTRFSFMYGAPLMTLIHVMVWSVILFQGGMM